MLAEGRPLDTSADRMRVTVRNPQAYIEFSHIFMMDLFFRKY